VRVKIIIFSVWVKQKIISARINKNNIDADKKNNIDADKRNNIGAGIGAGSPAVA